MDYKTFQTRERVPTVPEGPSRTHQSFKDECDINTLMRRYQKTGVLEHVNRVQGNYGDYSVVPDYATALQRIESARQMFMTIPARIRADFQNDPGRFLAFVENPENEMAMREIGLLPSKPPQAAEPGTGSPAPEPAPGA